MKEIRKLLFGEGYDPYDKLKLLPLDMQGWNSQASIFGRIITVTVSGTASLAKA